MPYKAITPEKIKEFSIVFLGEECTIPYRYLVKSEFPKTLVDYINQGGALFFLFTSNGIMHNTRGSSLLANIIRPAFNIRQRGWCENPKACGYGDPLQIWTDNIASHPVTRHVAQLQFFVSSTLDVKDKEFTPLALSRKDDLRQPSKPIAIAGEVENGGRIFIVGDTLWTQPERVEEKDNLQFLMNAIHWLGKKPIEKINKNALIDKLIINKARMLSQTNL